MTRSTRRTTVFALALALLCAATAGAQEVFQHKGVDSRVDYTKLAEIGQWDDRNYQLTQEDLDLLADDEAKLGGAVPAFFRVEVRKAWPDTRRRTAEPQRRVCATVAGSGSAVAIALSPSVGLLAIGKSLSVAADCTLDVFPSHVDFQSFSQSGNANSSVV